MCEFPQGEDGHLETKGKCGDGTNLLLHWRAVGRVGGEFHFSGESIIVLNFITENGPRYLFPFLIR